MSSVPVHEDFDLDAYCARIGYAGVRQPTLAVLEALHFAHATRIPFENLDVLLKRPIRLDLASLQAKLVRGGRGGYCFEHNLLLLAALEALGFAVTPLAARVRYRTERLLPRTHMLLRVALDGRDWLADVGFGGEGLLRPVAMDGEPSAQFAWSYRVAEASPGLRVLQSQRGEAWEDLYAFTPEPQLRVDYEVASWYVSTHPESRFVQTLTAQLPSPERRLVLRGRELVEDRGGEAVASRTLADEAEVLAVLAERFGLRLPPGTRLEPGG